MSFIVNRGSGTYQIGHTQYKPGVYETDDETHLSRARNSGLRWITVHDVLPEADKRKPPAAPRVLLAVPLPSEPEYRAKDSKSDPEVGEPDLLPAEERDALPMLRTAELQQALEDRVRALSNTLPAEITVETPETGFTCKVEGCEKADEPFASEPALKRHMTMKHKEEAGADA